MPPPIKVELLPHSESWAIKASQESDRIISALGKELVLEVHHIGSTSIEGICAKPIIDLMPEVSDLNIFDKNREAIELLGYQWWGEYGISGRRYCTLDDASGCRQVQLHCFQSGDPQLERHLVFRNYLREFEEIAKSYDAEKRRCRALHPDDSHAYSEAKSEWISNHLADAFNYYSHKQT